MERVCGRRKNARDFTISQLHCGNPTCRFPHTVDFAERCMTMWQGFCMLVAMWLDFCMSKSLPCYMYDHAHLEAFLFRSVHLSRLVSERVGMEPSSSRQLRVEDLGYPHEEESCNSFMWPPKSMFHHGVLWPAKSMFHRGVLC